MQSCEEHATEAANGKLQRRGWEIFPRTADYVSARAACSSSCSVLSSQVFPEISPLSLRTTSGQPGLTQTDVPFQYLPMFLRSYLMDSYITELKGARRPLFLRLTGANS